MSDQRSALNTASIDSAAPHGVWILAAVILTSSLAFIDGTVINVALPALQRDLHADIADVQWVVEAYSLFLAALLLVGGAAGDRFGRRRVLLLGVVIFTLASIGCGFATTIYELIVGRALQGIGGALLVPGSLAIISASFDERRRGRAIGIWSGATAITAALGPVLGGWLIDHLSWRAAFFINVPLAVVIVLLTLWRVPESRNARLHGGLDGWGALLGTLGLGGIVYACIESSRHGWINPSVLGALILGLAALAGFIVVEERLSAPMIPLKLFRSRTFSGANVLTFLLYAALGGNLFFFPLNLIQLQGYSAFEAGAALLPFILLMFMLSGWSGGLVARYGARKPLTIGPAIAALGFALFTLPGRGGSYWLTFFPAVVVLGVGMSISVAPLTTAVMNSVATASAGVAAGINNAASRVAGLLAIAIFGMVFTAVFNSRLDNELERASVSLAAQQVIDEQRSKLAAIELPDSLGNRDQTAAREVIGNAFVAGFRWTMIIGALCALLSAVAGWRFIEDTPPGKRSR